MASIAVIAYETTGAVCSSMMMHADMMTEAGNDITLIISDKVDKKWFEGYSYEKVYYSTRKDLKRIVKEYFFDIIWCTNSVYVLYLFVIGIRLPICLWMQGDTPEESYMAHHSKMRRFLLQRIVAFSFRKVAGIVYVSDAMKEYYETNYAKTPCNNIVVPCLSEFSSYNTDVKKIPDSYVYIGGLSLWQCFDEILCIYERIRTENSVLHIITLDTEKAKEKVKTMIKDDNNIEIYGITDRRRIPEILSKFQYGFLIRKNNIVNQVSSPIKFLEYISCGVNVIMTDAVPSYARIVDDYEIGTVVKMGGPYELKPFSDKAKQVYKRLFDKSIYVERYKHLIKKIQ